MLSSGNLKLAFGKSKLPRTSRCLLRHDVGGASTYAGLTLLRLTDRVAAAGTAARRLAKANDTDNHRCRDKRWDQNTPCYHIVREGM